MFLVFLILAIIGSSHMAVAGPQDEWTTPSLPDYSTSVVAFVDFEIRWSADLHKYFKEYCPSCDPRNAELWILGSDAVYLHPLSSGIDVVNSRSFIWRTSQIPSDLTRGNLLFTPPGGYVQGGEEVSSPMFEVQRDLPTSTDASTTSLPSPSKLVAVDTPIVQSSGQEPTTTRSSFPTATSSYTSFATASAPTEDAEKTFKKLEPRLETWKIILIAIGAVVVSAALAFWVGCCCRQKRSASLNRHQLPTYMNSSHQHHAAPAMRSPPLEESHAQTIPTAHQPRTPTASHRPCLGPSGIQDSRQDLSRAYHSHVSPDMPLNRYPITSRPGAVNNTLPVEHLPRRTTESNQTGLESDDALAEDIPTTKVSKPRTEGRFSKDVAIFIQEN